MEKYSLKIQKFFPSIEQKLHLYLQLVTKEDVKVLTYYSPNKHRKRLIKRNFQEPQNKYWYFKFLMEINNRKGALLYTNANGQNINKMLS